MPMPANVEPQLHIDSSLVEARFGRRGNFESSSESVRFFSKRGEGIVDVSHIHHPTSFREVCERCFCLCKSLCGVIFGGSSNLERICACAFRETSIESLSIPDGVVPLM